jgi:hypothetical protein
MIDKHALAIISIIGSFLDVLGALYLAYDLLGGEHGPLRTLTRAVTYGGLFAIGFGVALGPVFGLVCGTAHGITLAWELARTARNKPTPGFWYQTTMSAIRGASFVLGAAYLFGLPFGLSFGGLSTLGQIIAYQFGIRPSLDYAPAPRPRMTMRLFLATLNRTVGYTVAAYLSAWVAHQRDRALPLALEVGLLIGIVTAITSALLAPVEWHADHMPQRRMGVFGIVCILVGFTLQSVQYWVALFE